MDKKLIFIIFFSLILIVGTIVLLKCVGTICAIVFLIMTVILGLFTESEIDKEEKCQ